MNPASAPSPSMPSIAIDLDDLQERGTSSRSSSSSLSGRGREYWAQLHVSMVLDDWKGPSEEDKKRYEKLLTKNGIGSLAASAAQSVDGTSVATVCSESIESPLGSSPKFAGSLDSKASSLSSVAGESPCTTTLRSTARKLSHYQNELNFIAVVECRADESVVVEALKVLLKGNMLSSRVREKILTNVPYLLRSEYESIFLPSPSASDSAWDTYLWVSSHRKHIEYKRSITVSGDAPLLSHPIVTELISIFKSNKATDQCLLFGSAVANLLKPNSIQTDNFILDVAVYENSLNKDLLNSFLSSNSCSRHLLSDEELFILEGDTTKYAPSFSSIRIHLLNPETCPLNNAVSKVEATHLECYATFEETGDIWRINFSEAAYIGAEKSMTYLRQVERDRKAPVPPELPFDYQESGYKIGNY